MEWKAFSEPAGLICFKFFQTDEAAHLLVSIIRFVYLIFISLLQCSQYSLLIDGIALCPNQRYSPYILADLYRIQLSSIYNYCWIFISQNLSDCPQACCQTSKHIELSDSDITDEFRRKIFLVQVDGLQNLKQILSFKIILAIILSHSYLILTKQQQSFLRVFHRFFAKDYLGFESAPFSLFCKMLDKKISSIFSEKSIGRRQNAAYSHFARFGNIKS